MLLNIFLWIAQGIYAGYLSITVLDGAGYGYKGNIGIGILGAVLGGFLGSWWNLSDVNIYVVNIPSLVTASLMAFVFLMIAGLSSPKKK